MDILPVPVIIHAICIMPALVIALAMASVVPVMVNATDMEDALAIILAMAMPLVLVTMLFMEPPLAPVI